jgi:hypothetical protein
MHMGVECFFTAYNFVDGGCVSKSPLLILPRKRGHHIIVHEANIKLT